MVLKFSLSLKIEILLLEKLSKLFQAQYVTGLRWRQPLVQAQIKEYITVPQRGINRWPMD